MSESLDVGARGSEPVAIRRELYDFGGFYERTYEGSYRTALGIVRDAGLAADITQDAYIAAYRHRDRFRGEAPSIAWLHRIVVNQALAALRKRRPSSRVVDLSPSMAPDGAGHSVARLTLLQALDRLPTQQRAAVVLRYYHDHDYATIAQILGTTPTNVGAMLSRALDRLKVVIEPEPSPVPAAGG
jgi:RNA polymerase sigma-70 factor (ECF subfamily)